MHNETVAQLIKLKTHQPWVATNWSGLDSETEWSRHKVPTCCARHCTDDTQLPECWPVTHEQSHMIGIRYYTRHRCKYYAHTSLFNDIPCIIVLTLLLPSSAWTFGYLWNWVPIWFWTWVPIPSATHKSQINKMMQKWRHSNRRNPTIK